MSLRALALNCTLKAGEEVSSTERLCRQILEALDDHDVDGELVRVVDHDVRPGVSSDEGDGDAWPTLRQQVLDAQIFILATPIWLGQPSSVCKRVLERMDAFLGETDDQGRMPSFGRVALVGTVGNEDGAHHVAAELYQALSDVGFTIPATAQAYWVGEAMGSVDYQDLDDPRTRSSSASPRQPAMPRTWPASSRMPRTQERRRDGRRRKIEDPRRSLGRRCRPCARRRRRSRPSPRGGRSDGGPGAQRVRRCP